ncbi:NAD(P)-binding domain-containing protein [Pseudobacteroides cellulosolvens]|uniref:Pyrroline-5-carboxylate reductase n=1 Tax=Pseudobacteroides cellulosolvens ATCC 35603 = DSM 2933 TaxID=398512 RepID=A0A0L6JKR2_9FIRM|nr:NAD(P)-binding domain-containing protein [Pseudobacteroides cellulosolvens]KNY26421.1 Pyrroline-5-carboxylate reductase [Pseudobacteroides cellulosolvens ATCC 35603 = DSM 2933]
MQKIGLIGYGSMGSMLIDAFLSSQILKQEEIIISTRTQTKLELLKQRFPKIQTVKDNRLLAKECKILFVCVEPMEVKRILDEIRKEVSRELHLVSIAACVTIEYLESVFNGKVTKVIPSVTSEVGFGVSLICHNSKVGSEDALVVESLFNAIGSIKVIKEKHFEIAADLTSCAPGLISAIFLEYIKASLPYSDFSPSDTEDMLVSTFYGTAKLMQERNLGFNEIIKRVATSGGITERGVEVLRKGLPSLFDSLFKNTLEKHGEIKGVLKTQFNSNLRTDL